MNKKDTMLAIASALSFSEPMAPNQRFPKRKVGSGKNRANIKKARKAKRKNR